MKDRFVFGNKTIMGDKTPKCMIFSNEKIGFIFMNLYFIPVHEKFDNEIKSQGFKSKVINDPDKFNYWGILIKFNDKTQSMLFKLRYSDHLNFSDMPNMTDELLDHWLEISKEM